MIIKKIEHGESAGYNLPEEYTAFVTKGVQIPINSHGKEKYKGALRAAITCPNTDYVWYTADYSAEEFCLIANFSKDPVLIEPLQQGKDIHLHISKVMFGFEDPNNRTSVKIINFSSNYGATGATIARKLKIPVEKGKQLLAHYYKVLHKLWDWKQEMIKLGRRKGLVFTYFGRPRLVYPYYNSSSRSDQGYGDRTCVSHVVQGCVPVESFVELDDRVVSVSEVIGQKVLQNRHSLVASHRGYDELFLVLFESGDFTFVNEAHGFIYHKNNQPMVNRLDSVNLSIKNDLSPLHKKVSPNWISVLSKSGKKAHSELVLMCNLNKEIKLGDKRIATNLAAAWLTNKWFVVSNEVIMMRLRSLASLYGYNVKMKLKKDKVLLKYFRSRKKTSKIKCVIPTGKCSETATFTALNKFQTYNLCGVVNKNTGGDLIRIVLIKWFKAYYADNEFGKFLRENTIFLNTVHDEINLAVKPHALYRVNQFVHKIMYYHPSNFQVPIKESPGFSVPFKEKGVLKPANWCCIDFDYVSEDNQVHFKAYEDEQGNTKYNVLQ